MVPMAVRGPGGDPGRGESYLPRWIFDGSVREVFAGYAVSVVRLECRGSGGFLCFDLSQLAPPGRAAQQRAGAGAEGRGVDGELRAGWAEVYGAERRAGAQVQ